MYHHYEPQHPFAGLGNTLTVHHTGIVHKNLNLTSLGLGYIIYPVCSIRNRQILHHRYYSDTISVPLCYDDWYLYAVNNGTQIRYGLYKMREQEFDDEDGNNPGVTISFIAFDTSRLFTCLNDDSQSNQYELYKAFLRTVGPQRETHDDVLTQYFANTASTGPYLIGESYVSYIATTCADENGVIALPTLFSSNFNDSTRVRNALTTINSSAGYTITDLTAKTITVADTYNMTLQEKQAILCAFCTNATFNSFAAEVEFHADGIYDWRADIPIVGDTWYLRACRADMAIGEVGEEDPFTDYYDLDSDIVVAQRAIHGDR